MPQTPTSNVNRPFKRPRFVSGNQQPTPTEPATPATPAATTSQRKADTWDEYDVIPPIDYPGPIAVHDTTEPYIPNHLSFVTKDEADAAKQRLVHRPSPQTTQSSATRIRSDDGALQVPNWLSLQSPSALRYDARRRNNARRLTVGRTNNQAVVQQGQQTVAAPQQDSRRSDTLGAGAGVTQMNSQSIAHKRSASEGPDLSSKLATSEQCASNVERL